MSAGVQHLCMGSASTRIGSSRAVKARIGVAPQQRRNAAVVEGRMAISHAVVNICAMRELHLGLGYNVHRGEACACNPFCVG